MRLPFLSMFMTSPFERLQEHTQKVKECAWTFQQAMECHISNQCQAFDELRQQVLALKREADTIKGHIRGHLPKQILMPVPKFQLFLFLQEQDHILDSVEDALDWISYRFEPGIPGQVQKDFFILVDGVIDPIEALEQLVVEAKNFFKKFSRTPRKRIKEIIGALRDQEQEVARMEAELKQKIFTLNMDAVTVYHMIHLTEIIGAIADHAENAGSMMRNMVAR
jgi:predicted phosphate transport protein (TIGR00153 family)